MPNRLQYEDSPYLKQHQNNPFDWYSWCDEAFECRFHSKFPAVSQTCFHFFNGESGCKIVA